MKYLVIPFLFWFQISSGQTKSTIYVKEFGWTATLPPKFKVIDTATLNEENRKLSSEIHWIKKPTDSNYNKLLILIRDNHKHDFTLLVIDSIHEKLDSNFSDYDKGLKLSGKSNLSTVVYGGVKFYKLETKMHVQPNVSYTIVNLRSLYNGMIFKANYAYDDEITPAKIENMLLTSKFDR